MCFGRGEGLPGRVREEGHPILLKDLQSGYFRRTVAAKQAGLTCATAIPFYSLPPGPPASSAGWLCRARS